MKNVPVPSAFRKFMPDVLAGVTTFVLILGLSWGDTTVSAKAVSQASMVTSHHSGHLMAAAVFAAIVSFNSAFIRHLMRTYRLPRRVTLPAPVRRAQGE